MAEHTPPDERLDAALRAWDAERAPDDLADEVVARWMAERAQAGGAAARPDAPGAAARPDAPGPASTPAPRPRAATWRRRALAAAGATTLLAAGLALGWLAGHDTAGPAAPAVPNGAPTGDRTFAARETVALGGRAVAVAEQGAALRWNVAGDGAALVEQPAGTVFYRVEGSAAPFAVATPAGIVSVLGTCFRVAVEEPMKPSRSAVAGAAVGAALAAVVTVAVFEGRVLFANERGSVEVPAGASARADGSSAPALGAGPGVAARALLDPPAPDATRDDLLDRDAAARSELARLRARLATLESATAAAAAGPTGMPGRGETRWFDPPAEELAAMAAECEVRWDLPTTPEGPLGLDPDVAEELHLSASDAEAVRRADDTFYTAFLKELRALYVEATGDEAGATALSTIALGNEITDKGLPGERRALQGLLARERAGLAAPPADLRDASPLERYMRLMAGLGDSYERTLASVVGPERAREMRAHNGGWPTKWNMKGCPKDAPAP